MSVQLECLIGSFALSFAVTTQSSPYMVQAKSKNEKDIIKLKFFKCSMLFSSYDNNTFIKQFTTYKGFSLKPLNVKDIIMALVLITSTSKHIPSTSSFLLQRKDTLITRLLLPTTRSVTPTVILPFLWSRILNIVCHLKSHLYLRKIERKYQNIRKGTREFLPSILFMKLKFGFKYSEF